MTNENISIETQVKEQIEFALYMYANILNKKTDNEQTNDYLREQIDDLIDTVKIMSVKK